MSRDIPAALETAVEESVVRPFLAVHIALPDPVYVFTGAGTIFFPDTDDVSHPWIGAGEFGSIDTIGEGTDGSATGVKVTLNRVPAELADDVNDQATRGAAFSIYFGVLDQSQQIVTATQLIWRGRLDEYRIVHAGETLSVEVTAESRAIDQRRPSIKRFTNEYQQRQHSGDKVFEYVPQMAEIPILWAAASQNSTGGGSGGYSGYGGFGAAHAV
jgi:hypothetical protein